ncbi:RNA polymerase sigma-54 factor [Candidatus Desantisbacteria bacterium CG07_land_8_20_14_0_80_39_15]|uniref:RNA polymerase sigma-54 factor n=2 Tax=unclassified Candidatus Desantisiibacteriota TaxID=3106372 RepID=A0A2H9PBE3_9BACT|nr:MAG: RNA polymerase sigma-54 factor [Candidatus Desantisbacteria bacterium CG07_land_8_20_14_0_80_39_15]PIZ15223.1 MAG: RNA polymerase sigma-54 factor [Candidatus Desantisbacteria bacterium CG_4_10_14_0_8_um_filter_39_17]
MQLRQEIKQGLKQEQWMKLQMMQFMKILQLPTLELQQFVQNELEQNPVLEISERKDEAVEKIEEEEVEFKPQEESPPLSSFPSEKRESTTKILEVSTPTKASLHEYLMEQLSFNVKDFKKLKIGEFLIGNINERGYLCITVEDASQILKTDTELVEKTLKIIQGLDPPGVGARNLSECLLIQLKNLHLDDGCIKLAQQMVERHLEDLAMGKFNKIAKDLNAKEEDIRNINQKISRFNPHPGETYGQSRTRNVMPDIIVRQENGDYEVVVNSGLIPRLHINPLYQKMLLEKNPSAKKYLRGKMNSALFLIKALGQRQELLYKISLSLVKIQRDFLDKGVGYLKSLNMEEMAKIQQVHPSTISRAIADKYIQTPRGIFPFKFFFSQAVNGSDVSSNSIKKRIDSLVKGEDKSRPLSDLKIAKKLKEEGFNLSRRTVAKYRQDLNIPSTLKRRIGVRS